MVAFLFSTPLVFLKIVAPVATVGTPCCPSNSDEDLPGIMSIGSGQRVEELYNEGVGPLPGKLFDRPLDSGYRSGRARDIVPICASNPPSSVYRNAKRERESFTRLGYHAWLCLRLRRSPSRNFEHLEYKI